MENLMKIQRSAKRVVPPAIYFKTPPTLGSFCDLSKCDLLWKQKQNNNKTHTHTQKAMMIKGIYFSQVTSRKEILISNKNTKGEEDLKIKMSTKKWKQNIISLINLLIKELILCMFCKLNNDPELLIKLYSICLKSHDYLNTIALRIHLNNEKRAT